MRIGILMGALLWPIFTSCDALLRVRVVQTNQLGNGQATLFQQVPLKIETTKDPKTLELECNGIQKK